MSFPISGGVTPDDTPSDPTAATDDSSGTETLVDSDVTASTSGATLSPMEVLAEFAAGVATLDSGLTLTRRPDAIAFDELTCFTVGPVNQGDNSLGPTNRLWRARCVGTNFLVARANDSNTAWEAETILFTFDAGSGAVVAIDVAFDQNARIIVCAERPTGVGGLAELWLYWFDPTPSAFVFQSFGQGRTPEALLDNPQNSAESDILIFYMNDSVNGMCYRQQRDRFAVEYTTPISGNSLNTYVEDVMPTSDNRIRVVLAIRDPSTGRYTLQFIESTLYPYIAEQLAKLKVGFALIDGSDLHTVLVQINTPADDNLKVGYAIASAVWALILSAYTAEVEPLKVSYSLPTGSTLIVLIIAKTLFDIEPLKVGYSLATGSTLIVIVITHTVFDIQAMKVGYALQSGTLA